MYKKILACSMLFILTTTNALSSEKFLTKVRTNMDSNSYQIKLEINDDFITEKLFFDTYNSHGERTNRKEFNIPAPTENLRMVLIKASGRNAVVFESKNFTNAYGGDIKVLYLSNGMTGKMKNIMLELSRNGEQWNLLDGNKKPIKKMYIRVKKILGKIYGVKKIELHK